MCSWGGCMKKCHLLLSIAVILITLVGFSSCENFIEFFIPDLNTGTLVINLQSDAVTARTLLPDISMNIASYKIIGSGPDGETFTTEVGNVSSFSKKHLQEGSWTIVIEAYNAGDAQTDPVKIGQGEKTTTIQPAVINNVEITVSPVTGTGVFDLTINWEETLINPSLDFTLTNESDTTVPESESFSTTGLQGTLHIPDLATGYYLLQVTLKEDGVPVGYTTETLRIIDSQTTSGELEIIVDHTGDLALSITEMMDNPIDVTLTGAVSILEIDTDMTVTAETSESADTYAWYLNGIRLEGNTGTSITIGTGLEQSKYRLTCVVWKSNVLSSGSIDFEVSEHPVYQIPNGDTTIPLEMRIVNAGTFTMGSPDTEIGRYPNESPQHEVKITNDYFMGKYEITQEQWEAVMGSNPSYWIGNNLPVERVSWYDAVEFCNALSVLLDLEPFYTIDGTIVTSNWSKNGFRLPTEAEWEYAARGGEQENYQIYSGSDDLSEVGWYRENSGMQTHPVGQKSANELGIYDMSGNVWEWAWDWYEEDYYLRSYYSDPLGPVTGTSHTKRGGSWGNSISWGCRSAIRGGGSPPDDQDNDLGFRIVRNTQSENNSISRFGLAAEYLFNNNALDSSGNGYNGVVSGAVITEDRYGEENSAYHFDGIDDNISLGNTLTTDFTSITVSVWVRIDSFPTLNAGVLVKTGSTSTSKDWQLDFHINQTPEFAVAEGYGGVASTSPEAAELDTWYHLVGIYDGETNETAIYVDGVEKDRDVHSITWSHTTQGLYIGYGADIHRFHGDIDDIHIYNRVLTDSEIIALYNE